MAGSWLRGVIGGITHAVRRGSGAGGRGESDRFRRRIVNQRDAGYCPGV